MRYYISIVFFSALFLFSCTQEKVFDEVKPIPKTGWEDKEKVMFTVPVTDTSLVYDIWVHVRNSTDYEFSNLWMFINTVAPNGDSMTDTVEFILADPSGKWLGSGLGAINSMLVSYKNNIRFPFRGIYTFEFKQAMRREQLSGILDVGMRIEERK